MKAIRCNDYFLHSSIEYDSRDIYDGVLFMKTVNEF